MKTIFTEFGRLIFLFNAYQAPPRLNPQQAARDALGLTDLFAEMLTDITREEKKQNIGQC